MLLARQVLLRSSRSLVRNGSRTLPMQAQILRAASTATNNNQESQTNIKQSTAIGLAALAGAFAAGTATFAESEYWHPPKPVSNIQTITKEKSAPSKFYSITADNIPPKRPDLPTIPLENVAEHNDEGDIWFTFRGAVYDMYIFLYV